MTLRMVAAPSFTNLPEDAELELTCPSFLTLYSVSVTSFNLGTPAGPTLTSLEQQNITCERVESSCAKLCKACPRLIRQQPCEPPRWVTHAAKEIYQSTSRAISAGSASNEPCTYYCVNDHRRLDGSNRLDTATPSDRVSTRLSLAPSSMLQRLNMVDQA